MISEEEFFILPQKLLTQASITQIVATQRGSTIEDANTARPTTTLPSTIPNTPEEQENSRTKRLMFMHCTHEARFFGLKREIHIIHDSFCKNTPNGDIRLIVGHRNNHNLEFELAQKRPWPASILYDPSTRRGNWYYYAIDI